MKIRTVLKSKWTKFTGALCCAMGVVSMTTGRVLASDPFANITGEPGSNDVFGGMTSVAQDVGNSAINLFTVGGAILVVVGIILCGMCLIFFKGDSEVSKNKKHLLVIIGGAILIFGAIGIGKGMANIGNSVSESFKEAGSGQQQQQQQPAQQGQVPPQTETFQ